MACTATSYACPLGAGARSVMVSGRGSDSPKVLLVGEAPGKDEDFLGKCFVGASGKKLDDILTEAGLPPEAVRISNICRCIPWDDQHKGVRAPTEDEAKVCIEHLYWEIEQTNPAVIVPLGNTAAYWLAGTSGIKRITGQKFEFKVPHSQARRFIIYLSQHPEVWQGKYPTVASIESAEAMLATMSDEEKLACGVTAERAYPVIPTYHPAAILYGTKEAEGAIRAALQTARALADGVELVPTDGYILLSTLEEIQEKIEWIISEYRAGRIKRISADLEAAGERWEDGLDPFNKHARILCVGISWAPGQAVLVPFKHRESPFKGDLLAISAIRELLRRLLDEVPVVNQNILFDAYYAYVTEGILFRKIVGDCMQASWWLYGTTIPHDLEFLASRFVGMVAHKEEMQRALEAAARWVTIPAEGKKRPKREKIKATYDDVSLEIHRKYCCGDADAALRVTDVLEAQIEEQSKIPERHLGGLDAYRREMIETIYPAIEMQSVGTKMDRPVLEEAIKQFAHSLQDTRQWFIDNGLAAATVCVRNELTGMSPPNEDWFNLNSKYDLETLFGKVLQTPLEYGAPTEKAIASGKKKKGDRGEPCFAEWAVARYVEYWQLRQGDKMAPPGEAEWATLALEALKRLKTWKGDGKLYGTYLAPLPDMIREGDIIHWDFNVCNTATGRWSAFVHTIPWRSKTKEATISKFSGGLLLDADESQIEMRVGASMAGDENFIELLKMGGDIHREVAAMVFHMQLYLQDREAALRAVTDAQRRQCKTVDFGIFYGRGASAIAEDNNIPLEQAKQIISDFFHRFPRIKAFAKERYEAALETGCIWNPCGWCHVIPEHLLEDDATGAISRYSINYPVQGAAAMITQKAMVRYQRWKQQLRLRSQIVMYIHDNIVTDVYPMELSQVLPLLQKELVDIPSRQYDWLKAPLVADYEVGRCWGRKMGIKILKERNHIRVSGKEEYFQEIWDIMRSWERPAELLSSGVRMENGQPVMKDKHPVFDAFIALPDPPEQAQLAA